MRCHYCFYRDEQQNRSTSEDCMMTLQTAETLIRRCFEELDQGGFVSFAFQGGEPTLAGLDFFLFFTQTVRKYNQKCVTVQYAIQTNGLAVAEEWAKFFREENFLVGISLDGTPDVHDALRPDVSGDGTWTRVMQMIKLLEQYHIECNLLCVVTKRLAKKAERVYKSMKTSVYKRYKQDKIEMRGDRAEMSDFPLYLNTVAGGLDRRDQTIGGFSFVVKIYAVPVVEIIG